MRKLYHSSSTQISIGHKVKLTSLSNLQIFLLLYRFFSKDISVYYILTFNIVFKETTNCMSDSSIKS